MDKDRKIECDCGKVMEEKIALLEGNVKSEALVCPGCGYRTLTRQQAEKYFKLRRMKEDLEEERKIILIGNSIGITIPKALKKQGFKHGEKVKLEPIDEKSFKVSVV